MNCIVQCHPQSVSSYSAWQYWHVLCACCMTCLNLLVLYCFCIFWHNFNRYFYQVVVTFIFSYIINSYWTVYLPWNKNFTCYFHLFPLIAQIWSNASWETKNMDDQRRACAIPTLARKCCQSESDPQTGVF